MPIHFLSDDKLKVKAKALAAMINMHMAPFQRKLDRNYAKKNEIVTATIKNFNLLAHNLNTPGNVSKYIIDHLPGFMLVMKHLFAARVAFPDVKLLRTARLLLTQVELLAPPSFLIQKFMIDHANKGSASHSPPKAVKDLIEKIGYLEQEFNDDNQNYVENHMAETIEQIKEILNQTGGVFPDQTLLEATEALIKKLLPLTPIPVLFVKHPRSFTAQFDQSRTPAPDLTSFKLDATASDDESCCWDPIKYIFG